MAIVKSAPLNAALFLWAGLRSLLQPGLRRYVWLPLLINLVVYGLGFWAAGHYFSAAMNWLIPGWLDWLRWLLWPIFAVLLLAIGFFTFTVVANLIGSPFYGVLAERVVQVIAGETVAGNGKSLVRNVAESLLSETSRMGYFALRALPILVLLVIPGVNAIAAVLWTVFGAWAMALEYLSYPLENDGVLFPRQRQLLKGRRLDVLAFGGAVMLGLAIPVVNILIPPAAVIGATLYVLDRKRAEPQVWRGS